MDAECRSLHDFWPERYQVRREQCRLPVDKHDGAVIRVMFQAEGFGGASRDPDRFGIPCWIWHHHAARGIVGISAPQRPPQKSPLAVQAASDGLIARLVVDVAEEFHDSSTQT